MILIVTCTIIVFGKRDEVLVLPDRRKRLGFVVGDAAYVMQQSVIRITVVHRMRCKVDPKPFYSVLFLPLSGNTLYRCEGSCSRTLFQRSGARTDKA